MRSGRQRSWRQGFTLVETLMVTAIVVIMLAISAVGVVYYSRWLKITELDNAAREIYLAAENRAVLLSGSGRLESLVASAGGVNNQIKLWDRPDGTTTDGYYIYSGSVAEDLLPLGTIDPALMEGRFYIVYEPKSGSVTDVFYAEDELSIEDFQEFYTEVSNAARSVRMQMKPMVGHYGGGAAENSRDDALGTPIVTIINEETLTAEITYAVLPAMKDKTDLTVKLNYGECEIDIALDPTTLLQEEKDGRVRFTYTIMLDSLEDGKHFSDLFTYEINKPDSFGGDFIVTATLTAEGATPSSGSDTNNSLFAEGSGSDTAYIANLRHLQNLNKSTSDVDGKTKAVQKNDIDCAVYLENDYIFTPIQNDKLASYDGSEFVLRGLRVEAESGNAGLFAQVSGTSDQSWEFKNIRVVNASASAKSTGGCAGALVGSAQNTVFENCWVYWEPEAGSANLRSVLGDNESGYTYQITGDSAGGLAGQLTGGTITDCLAATLVKGQEAGGLVGKSTGTVNITNSYADSYLSGSKVGGLVGTAATLTLKNCYAAGFVEITDETGGSAAGLCPTGNVTVNSVYSVVRCTSGTENWKPLATVTGDSINYYYLLSTIGSEVDVHAKTYVQMADDDFAATLGDDFGRKGSGDSHPYNLRTDLALTVYELPGLENLPHYGDWNAQFVEASLVYYEQYLNTSDTYYGFSGGGVNILDDKKSIIKDGYAIAILKDNLPDDGKLTVKINDVNYTYSESDAVYKLYPVTGPDGTDYLLAPLPDDLINTDAASEKFYQKLSFTINGEKRDYYYCPHFAKTAVKADTEFGEEDTEIDTLLRLLTEVSVRTPRHLYMLSQHKEYYNGNYTFIQELDLDYDVYTGYDLFQTDFIQTPIGSIDVPFNGVYDGGCHTISGLVFQEDAAQTYAGLFGYSIGTLRNIVYHMNAGSTNTVSVGNYNILYIGGLAGGNAGSIVNCAVEGVNLRGNAYTATVYIGGLVGLNQGNISNSAAECAALAADVSTYAHAYVGGLVGLNQSSGIIATSYAVGLGSADADSSSDARVCGFAGYNQGLIQNSYAAMDLVSSGKAVETYGFCGVTEGNRNGNFFLNIGNFTYRDISYNASYTPRGANEIRYEALTERTGGSPVAGMSFIKVDEESSDPTFPYPTAVKDANGNPTHHGEWPEQTVLGAMGVYYWEKLEIEGVNPTYHISLLAVDSNSNTITKRTTLSNAHVDNGVVTDYGYGYYYDERTSDVTLTAADISYSADGGVGSTFTVNAGNEATEANTALAALMPGYTFHSYHSYGMGGEGGLYPTGDYKIGGTGTRTDYTRKPNGTFTLAQSNGVSVTFTLNPHFADALSVTLPNGWDPEKSNAPTAAPGSTEGNPYEVRALSQLQNINWCMILGVDDIATGLATNRVVENDNSGSYNGNQKGFLYLSHAFSYTTTTSSGRPGQTQTTTTEKSELYNYYWVQTHDIDGKHGAEDCFTPIAAFRDLDTTKETTVLTAWFGGSYDGGDYTIKNINIAAADTNCVGLFGVTLDATLKNIILYSENGDNTVTVEGRNSYNDYYSWYAAGGLVGLAAKSTENGDAAKTISNCTVAGYTIVDLTTDGSGANSTTAGGTNRAYGGGVVGGLVGVCNLDLSNCTATNIIWLNYTRTSSSPTGSRVRAGGLAGTCVASITNCYSGGEIRWLDGEKTQVTYKNDKNESKGTGNVYAGHIMGGWGMRPIEVPGYTVTVDLENSTIVSNSYSTVQLPLGQETHLGTSNVGYLRNCYAIGGGGGTAGVDVLIRNCYYTSGGWISGVNTDSDITAVTYAQLTGDEVIPAKGNRTIYDLLTDFSPITSMENGFSVAGKYSYPSAANLQGLNYPFPTILTRGNGQYHVHYGNWPLNGIKRELGGAPIELDLFTNSNHTEKLELEGIDAGGTWRVEVAPVITGETDENGEPVTKKIVNAEINQTGNLTVTALGVGVTTLTVTYEVGGVTCTLPLSVNVTAVLELGTEDSPVHLFTNDTVGVLLNAYGKGDSEGNTPELNLSDLGLEIKALVGAYDADMLNNAEMDKDDGLILNLVTGTTEGDTTVSISYTYTYNGVEYTGLSAITFHVTEPEIKDDEGENKRTVAFKDAVIEDFQVAVEGTLGASEGKLEFNKKEGNFTLDMNDIPAEASVTVEVTLIMNGRRHVVTVPITAEKQGGEDDGAFIELNLLSNPIVTKQISLEDVETGGKWSVQSADSKIADAKIDENSGELTVTSVDAGTTTLTVTYTTGEKAYVRLLSVNVTAMPDLQLFTNDSVDVKLMAYGESNGDGIEQEIDLSGRELKVTEVSGYDKNLLNIEVADDGSALNLTTGNTAGVTQVSITYSYTYTYNSVEYTGSSETTFQVEVTEPEIKKAEEGNYYIIVFNGEEIKEAKVTGVEAGEQVKVKVSLTMDGREHKVTVAIPAEEQGGEGVGAFIEMNLLSNPKVIQSFGLDLEVVEAGGEWRVESADSDIADAEINNNGELTVTGKDVGVTRLTVTYTIDGKVYTWLLSVNVTAVLELGTASTSVQMFTNDTVGVKLTACGKYDSEGQEQILDLDELDLKVTVLKGEDDADVLKTAEMGDDLTLNLTTGSTAGGTTVSISYTYTYKGVEYAGSSEITFQVNVTEPRIEKADEGNDYTIFFDGAEIISAEVTDGNLGEGEDKLTLDGENRKVILNMTDVEAGEAVTVKVSLTRDGLEHKVTVTILAGEQNEDPDESGGEDSNPEDEPGSEAANQDESSGEDANQDESSGEEANPDEPDGEAVEQFEPDNESSDQDKTVEEEVNQLEPDVESSDEDKAVEEEAEQLEPDVESTDENKAVEEEAEQPEPDVESSDGDKAVEEEMAQLEPDVESFDEDKAVEEEAEQPEPDVESSDEDKAVEEEMAQPEPDVEDSDQDTPGDEDIEQEEPGSEVSDQKEPDSEDPNHVEPGSEAMVPTEPRIETENKDEAGGEDGDQDETVDEDAEQVDDGDQSE